MLQCQYCGYSTKRADNLNRHMRVEHSNLKMAQSIVQDIINAVVLLADDEFQDDDGLDLAEITGSDLEDVLSDKAGQDEEYPIVRARNLRVAAIHDEFRRLHPSFEQELRDLAVTKKKQKEKKKSPSSEVDTRKSARNKGMAGDILGDIVEDVAMSEEDVGVEVEVGDDDLGTGKGSGDGQAGTGDSGGEKNREVDDDETTENIEDGSEVGGEDWAWGDPDVVDDCNGEVEVEDSALGRFGCLPCSLKCRDAANLRRHVRLVHQRRKVPVQCTRPWCKAQFFVLDKMLQHKNNCLKICPNTSCGKTFTRQDRFESHQRFHIVMARRMKD